MPTVKFQFTTFESITETAAEAWSDPENVESADGAFATASIDAAGTDQTELLVCTGADLSAAFPKGAVVQSVKVRIKGQIDQDSAQIDEIFAWDGTEVQGRNQANDWLMSPNSIITLTTTNGLHTRGVAGWLWWRLDRLKDDTNGIAIRTSWLAGTPTVSIDHVELEITYVQLFQKTPVVDYRFMTYERCAGHNDDDLTSENEGGEHYRPGISGGASWHTHLEDFLNNLIAKRTGPDIKRIVIGSPAGDEGDDGVDIVSSHQWEPMYDEQRAALTKVIPAWLKGDPEREAILYLGTPIDDPAHLDMTGDIHFPDVNDPDDVATLERTFFPYRDFVGIRRYFLDFSSPAENRTKARALFQWGRDNGMEFVMEAIPHDDEVLDETITENYSAYALSRFIIGTATQTGNDEDHLWHFTKGRLLVQVQSNDHGGFFDNEQEKRVLLRRFAREGYVLIARDHDGNLDEAARLVTEENIGVGVSSKVSSEASSSVAQSVTRFDWMDD